MDALYTIDVTALTRRVFHRRAALAVHGQEGELVGVCSLGVGG